MIKGVKNFFEEVKKQIGQDKLFLVIYYGASTTSQEYMFPNWGEIIRYVLKCRLEEDTGDFEKAFWNLQTINFGLNGANSTDLLNRFEKLVLDKKPNLIFLDSTKNDVYYQMDKKISEKNNISLISKALKKRIKIVFTTRIPALRDDLNKKIVEYNDIDKKVANMFKDNENFIFVDLSNIFPKDSIKKSYSLISLGENTDVGYKPGGIDTIHYNKHGNSIVAKILLKEVFNIRFNEEKFLKDIDNLAKKYPDF